MLLSFYLFASSALPRDQAENLRPDISGSARMARKQKANVLNARNTCSYVKCVCRN